MNRISRSLVAAGLALATAGLGCTYKFLFWERNIWQDTLGIFTMVAPADEDLYRQLLPEQFAMPEQPMVGVYSVHFADTEPWPITATEFLFPYYESTILLRCVHEGETGWYSHVMAVSTKAAMIGGHRLGFPKYVADEMTLERTANGWLGRTVHEGTNRITLRFTAKPVNELTPQTPLEEEFVNGRGDAAALVGPLILLIPPGEGPEVSVPHCTPPPLAEREAGEVEIDLSEPYDGLVPEGTVAVGLYQRFTLPGGGGAFLDRGRDDLRNRGRRDLVAEAKARVETSGVGAGRHR